MKSVIKSGFKPLAIFIAFILTGNASGAETGSMSGANIKLNDGDILTGDALYSGGLYGIINPYRETGEINLANNATINVTDKDNFARGINILGDNSTLTANSLTVNVTGKSANGITLWGDNITADLGTHSVVNTTGTGNINANGISVSNGSSLTASELTVTTTGDYGTGFAVNNQGSSASLGENSSISTSGNRSNGITIDALNGTTKKPSTLSASHLSVTTQGDYSYGVELQENVQVNLGTGSTLTTSGIGATGIWNFGELTAENLSVTTTGESAIGIETRGSSLVNIGTDSHVTSARAGGIVASGTNAVINYSGTAEQRNTLNAGGSYGASAQTSNSTVNLAETDIVSSDMGLWALFGGTITGHNLSIESGTQQRAAVTSMAGGEVDLTGDLTITMPSPEFYALAAAYTDGYAPSRINANGKLDMTGSVLSNGGQIDMTLQPGSTWTGSAYSDNLNGGYLNASLNESTWRVSDTSVLDLLALNQSSVDFTQSNSTAGYTTLTVADLKGSGDFTLRVDLVGDGDGVNNAGDKLIVTNSSEGDYSLSFVNRGSLATTGNERLTVVETPDGQASFSSKSDVELGGYLYQVRQAGTNWELYAAGTAPLAPVTPADPVPPADTVTPADTVIPVDSVTPVDPAPPADAVVTPPQPGAGNHNVITTTADAGANYLQIGYLLTYAENQTLLQRLGDIRQSESQGNVWLKGYGGKFSAFPGGKLSQFSMSYSGYQFGVDKNLMEGTKLFGGLFIGETSASPHYSRGGSGTAKSQHFGAYLTWVGENGFYIDQFIKYNRMSNAFNVKDSQNNPVSGAAKTNGLHASVEAGRRFTFSPDQQGFYIEPQLQLSAGRQKGTQIKATNGLTVSFHDYDSVMARASTLAGFTQQTSAGSLNLYLKTGVVREFTARPAYLLNGSAEENNFRGNWWNNGLGVSASLGNHNLYLEADASTGHRFNQRQVNAGYRFTF